MTVLNDEHRVRMLSLPRTGPVRMVLDTDTYNEIDDQFALTHALLAPDLVSLEAVYAAPFHNERSSGPGDGMRKSYAEILQVFDRLDGPRPPAFEGAVDWFSNTQEPSAAVLDLIDRAATGPLYVVAIGAITNIAVALTMAPEIAENIVVVWLGGHAGNWGQDIEFNLVGDIAAARVVYDSGVPLMALPCNGVADHLITTRSEIDEFVRPHGALGEFLADRYAEHVGDALGKSKVLWDIGATAWALNPRWLRTKLVPAAVIGADGRKAEDPTRHLMAEAYAVDRDAIYADLFRRLASR
jgi:purine nucleosidase